MASIENSAKQHNSAGGGQKSRRRGGRSQTTNANEGSQQRKNATRGQPTSARNASPRNTPRNVPMMPAASAGVAGMPPPGLAVSVLGAEVVLPIDTDSRPFPALPMSGMTPATPGGTGNSSRGTPSTTDSGTLRCFKTKRCLFYMQNRCTRNESCNFAHSDKELRHPPNLHKTKICVMWKKGRCHDSRFCNYAHGYQDLREMNDIEADVSPVQVCTKPGLDLDRMSSTTTGSLQRITPRSEIEDEIELAPASDAESSCASLYLVSPTSFDEHDSVSFARNHCSSQPMDESATSSNISSQRNEWDTPEDLHFPSHGASHAADRKVPYLQLCYAMRHTLTSQMIEEAMPCQYVE